MVHKTRLYLQFKYKLRTTVIHKKVNISISKCLSWVTCMSFHLQVKFEI